MARYRHVDMNQWVLPVDLQAQLQGFLSLRCAVHGIGVRAAVARGSAGRAVQAGVRAQPVWGAEIRG